MSTEIPQPTNPCYCYRSGLLVLTHSLQLIATYDKRIVTRVLEVFDIGNDNELPSLLSICDLTPVPTFSSSFFIILVTSNQSLENLINSSNHQQSGHNGKGYSFSPIIWRLGGSGECPVVPLQHPKQVPIITHPNEICDDKIKLQ